MQKGAIQYFEEQKYPFIDGEFKFGTQKRHGIKPYLVDEKDNQFENFAAVKAAAEAGQEITAVHYWDVTINDSWRKNFHYLPISEFQQLAGETERKKTDRVVKLFTNSAVEMFNGYYAEKFEHGRPVIEAGYKIETNTKSRFLLGDSSKILEYLASDSAARELLNIVDVNIDAHTFTSLTVNGTTKEMGAVKFGMPRNSKYAVMQKGTGDAMAAPKPQELFISEHFPACSAREDCDRWGAEIKCMEFQIDQNTTEKGRKVCMNPNHPRLLHAREVKQASDRRKKIEKDIGLLIFPGKDQEEQRTNAIRPIQRRRETELIELKEAVKYVVEHELHGEELEYSQYFSDRPVLPSDYPSVLLKARVKCTEMGIDFGARKADTASQTETKLAERMTKLALDIMPFCKKLNSKSAVFIPEKASEKYPSDHWIKMDYEQKSFLYSKNVGARNVCWRLSKQDPDLTNVSSVIRELEKMELDLEQIEFPRSLDITDITHQPLAIASEEVNHSGNAATSTVEVHHQEEAFYVYV